MTYEFGSYFRTPIQMLGVLGLAITVGISNAAAIELKAETGVPPSSVQGSVIVTAFAKELAKRSNGDVTVNITFGGARAKLTEISDAVSSGILDMGVIVTPYTPGHFPILSTIGTSDFRQTTGGDLVAVNAITATLIQEFPALQQEFTKRNIKILGFGPVDELILFTRSPVMKLADLQGKKIRGHNEGAIRILNDGGATGMAIPISEVATSLQTGLIDGVWTNAGYGVAVKFYEIAKYATYVDIRAVVPTVLLAMNLDKYKSLSPAQKAALEETYRAMLVETGKLVEGERTDSIKFLKSDSKVVYTELPKSERDAWVQRTPDTMDQAAALLDPKGLPGKAITARIRELYKGYNDKTWNPAEAIAKAKL